MNFATCKTCGSELKIDAATQAVRCEFCDGPLVLRRHHGLFSDRTRHWLSIGPLPICQITRPPTNPCGSFCTAAAGPRHHPVSSR